MKRSLLLTFLVLLALFAGSSEIRSQAINITGKVVNSEGTPVSQATVGLVVAGLETQTDASGNFTLYQDNTAIYNLDIEGHATRFEGGMLYLHASGEKVRVRIVDLAGREVTTVIPEQVLHGDYVVHPGAYLDARAQNVYILQASVGGNLSAYKFIPPLTPTGERGLLEVSAAMADRTGRILKASATDSLYISHATYRAKSIPIDCYVCSFGDITISENVPEAPSNLTAVTPDATTVDLSWRDNSDNESGFRIEKSILQIDTWSEFAEIGNVSANVTDYTEDGLTQGRTYKYRVYAFNTGGNSPFSEEVTITTPAASPISISAPATSSGTFDITVTYSWPGMFGSTSDRFELEESTSPTSGFVKVANSPWGSRPATYTFTLTKTTGTYYYRARAYNANGFTGYTEVVAVSVNTPVQKAYLTVVNNSHYPMIDIRLNGQQTVGQGLGIEPGGTYTFEFTGSGNVSFVLGVGFWDGSYRNVWFVLSGNTYVTVGTTTTLTFENPTIAQIMSGFSSYRDWTGEYFDANLNMHIATFRFYSNGTWTLYDDGVAVGSGNVYLASWADYAATISFRLCPSCDAIPMAYPFAQFYYNNGPPGWPTILYTAQ